MLSVRPTRYRHAVAFHQFVLSNDTTYQCLRMATSQEPLDRIQLCLCFQSYGPIRPGHAFIAGLCWDFFNKAPLSLLLSALRSLHPHSIRHNNGVIVNHTQTLSLTLSSTHKLTFCSTSQVSQKWKQYQTYLNSKSCVLQQCLKDNCFIILGGILSQKHNDQD